VKEAVLVCIIDDCQEGGVPCTDKCSENIEDLVGAFKCNCFSLFLPWSEHQGSSLKHLLARTRTLRVKREDLNSLYESSQQCNQNSSLYYESECSNI
jgi:hypothetical protein